MQIFKAADFLIPQAELLKNWAVIACDQFTSQPEYWKAVAEQVGEKPSAYYVVFPEAELGADDDVRIASINQNMESYLGSDIFRKYNNSYVYVERTLLNGVIRRGIVGVIDLEAYDYSPDSDALIRATEKTVPERIPPRVKIRRNAPMELSHVLLLCDDPECRLVSRFSASEQLYDFDLMQGGGHISGWLVNGDAAAEFERRLSVYFAAADRKYKELGISPIYFAVGDGNHSLATAKTIWEDLKSANPELAGTDHPARWAMVELENLYDEAQQFEPIHRVVTGVDTGALLKALEGISSPDGHQVAWHTAGQSGTVLLDRALGELPVAVLQNFLDAYGKGSIDYIHGDDVAVRLAQEPDTIAFLLPNIDKNSLFKGIAKDGVLPRKTFSMGHAQEKRYYLECRRITEQRITR